MENYNWNQVRELLISQVKKLEENINRALNDTTVEAPNRYVSFKMFAIRYNQLVEETEQIYNLPQNSFPKYTLENMGSSVDTLWETQKEIMESVALQTGTLLTYLQSPSGDPSVSQKSDNRKVFIVHGHNHKLLDEVELMLRRVGLEPVIVKNEANTGRTIIEKIEDLTDVGFAIVLYTGCDEGRTKNTEELRDRARQNVIFEHGYLCAKLGRNNVVAINDDGIEIPSDLSGVLYIPRSASDWKSQLMREMQAAGLKFDPTKT